MDEILFALAVAANIASLVSLGITLWQDYKHRRMKREKKRGARGN
ncbi:MULTISPECIES: hypothetical protein [unclassified Adlercreutzia]|nr:MULTISPECIES: hypothetical protein [unclassified Adlercreutzia]